MTIKYEQIQDALHYFKTYGVNQMAIEALNRSISNKFNINDTIWYEEHHLIKHQIVNRIVLCAETKEHRYIQYNNRIPESICYASKDEAIDASVKRLEAQRQLESEEKDAKED